MDDKPVINPEIKNLFKQVSNHIRTRIKLIVSLFLLGLVIANEIEIITAKTTLDAGRGLFLAKPLFHAPSIMRANNANPAPNHAPTLT